MKHLLNVILYNQKDSMDVYTDTKKKKSPQILSKVKTEQVQRNMSFAAIYVERKEAVCEHNYTHHTYMCYVFREYLWKDTPETGNSGCFW